MIPAMVINLGLQDGLSLQEVIENIPTDPMSVFVYLLLAACMGWIAWGSRGKRKPRV